MLALTALQSRPIAAKGWNQVSVNRSNAVVCFLGLAIALRGLDAQSPTAEFFEKKIRPVLTASCYGCHASTLKKPMGGLVLDTKDGLKKGGSSGPVVIPGKPAQSLLLQALRYNDLRLKMPPTGKLPDSVIADFERWIATGAEDPRTEPSMLNSTPGPRAIDFNAGRRWWAFQPVTEHVVPSVTGSTWPRNKIDSFILQKLEKNGLKPSPDADPATLVRRAYLDLVGLQPSYETVQAFIHEPLPQRYEKLIDRLLASPRYGERWARYWLDVARYGEDGENPNGNGYIYAWRYRDWVIDALNQDVPYDRFAKLQLASDQMPGTPRDDLRALGLLGMSPAEHKEMKLSKVVIENLLLDEWDERLDVVSRGMLGLTVACARCHDHKFDPISSKDYYALAGVFASTSMATRPLHQIDPAAEARFIWLKQRLLILGFVTRTLNRTPGLDLEASKKKVAECQAEIDVLEPEMAAIKKRYPELALEVVPPSEEDQAAQTGKGAPKPKANPKAPFMNAVYDAGIFVDGSHPDVSTLEFHPGQARDLPVYLHGNAATPGEVAPRKFLTVLSKSPDDTFRNGSGRLELADKIFGDAASLAARVIVNRVWGWHFDKHLVRTPSDFGARGEPPTHPELLDDLAARFIAHGWSLKWLHREIMLSAAYRQSSQPRADAEKVDAENQLVWRMNPRRLDVEAYRDSLLQAAGKLNLEMYGPSLDLDAATNMRRTVYAKTGRGKMSDLFRLYDFPSPIQHSPMRTMTITPLQQLFVMNSPFLEDLSATLAKSVENEPSDTAKVRSLYRKILTRDPSASELDLSLTYVHGAPVQRFAHALLSTNEEIFWP
jgi:hypothetical protein